MWQAFVFLLCLLRYEYRRQTHHGNPPYFPADGVLDEMYGGGNTAGESTSSDDNENDSDESEDMEMEENAEEGELFAGGDVRHSDFFGGDG